MKKKFACFILFILAGFCCGVIWHAANAINQTLNQSLASFEGLAMLPLQLGAMILPGFTLLIITRFILSRI